MYYLIMTINKFRDALSDISAKTAKLVCSCRVDVSESYITDIHSGFDRSSAFVLEMNQNVSGVLWSCKHCFSYEENAIFGVASPKKENTVQVCEVKVEYLELLLMAGSSRSSRSKTKWAIFLILSSYIYVVRLQIPGCPQVCLLYASGVTSVWPSVCLAFYSLSFAIPLRWNTQSYSEAVRKEKS